MAQWFCFFMATPDNFLHIGITSNPEKTIAFYNGLISIYTDTTKKLNRLVYLIHAGDKETAENYFKKVSSMNKEQKEEIVKGFNPEMIELVIGEHIKLW